APMKKPVDGRKVTFFEPGSGEENTNNIPTPSSVKSETGINEYFSTSGLFDKPLPTCTAFDQTDHWHTESAKSSNKPSIKDNKEDEFRMPYHSHQQLPAGILPMVPEVAQAVGANQGLHTKEFNRVAANPAVATVTAMIARELLYAGTSPTADTIMKNNHGPAHTLHGPLTRPSEQLEYLSSVQGIEVEYKDFPKNNKNEFVSLINCSFQPPLISHGVGKEVESCHDMAALNILKLLSEMDQQSPEVPRTGNGPMSV
ncbi:hypothetical protein AB205_0042650, partial [Aquarana catesbeiana]